MTDGALQRERAQRLWAVAAVVAAAALGLLATQFSTPLIVVLALLGLLGALAFWAAPELGLLAIVFVSYLNLSDVLLRRFGGPVSAMDILVPLVCVAVLAQASWHRGSISGWQRLTLLLVAYGLAGVLSLLSARHPSATLEGLVDLVKDGLVAVLIVILIQRAAALRRVLWTLLAAGLLMGTINVHQALTDNFDSDYGGLAYEPMNYAEDGSHFAYRVVGPLGDPNFYGMVLLVLIPIALDRIGSSRSPAAKALAVATLVLCSMTIVFTYSRGALVAMCAVLALLVYIRRPRKRWVFASLVLALLISPLVPEVYYQRMGTIFEKLGAVVGTITRPQQATRIDDFSFRGRLSENLAAARMFLDHPVVGIGLDNYPQRYQDYSQEIMLDSRSGERSPHNLYLEVAAETGALGLLAFGAIICVTFHGMLIARRSLGDPRLAEIRGMIDSIAIALAGWLLSSLFLHGAHTRYFWLLIGIAHAASRIALAEAADSPQVGERQRVTD